ncbi:hypothetical protein WR25_12445 [Diploscapter pachys]|uniref:Uncharacterized protein n=1 Tax=Diploscapter pachys TaxID=2018661 RepID=A0A2A2JX81_9BILA|nr:hypothetical protein WR25_12445 [Diploscapter pachys]
MQRSTSASPSSVNASGVAGLSVPALCAAPRISARRDSSSSQRASTAGRDEQRQQDIPARLAEQLDQVARHGVALAALGQQGSRAIGIARLFGAGRHGGNDLAPTARGGGPHALQRRHQPFVLFAIAFGPAQQPYVGSHDEGMSGWRRGDQSRSLPNWALRWRWRSAPIASISSMG